MEWLAGWPEWLVWIGAGVGAVVAVAVLVCVIDAAMDIDRP